MNDKRDRITNDEIMDLLSEGDPYDLDDEAGPGGGYVNKRLVDKEIQYLTQNQTRYLVYRDNSLEVLKKGQQKGSRHERGSWGILHATPLKKFLHKVRQRMILPGQMLKKLREAGELLDTDAVKKSLDTDETKPLRVIIQGEKGIVHSSPLQSYEKP